jgi:hypothetical protein
MDELPDKKCESCGMPIEKGKYCEYCAPDGKLKSREEIREGWISFAVNSEGISRKTAEKRVDEEMRMMPAWK